MERAPVFIIPLGFLIVALLMHKSPGYASFYAILLIRGYLLPAQIDQTVLVGHSPGEL